MSDFFKIKKNNASRLIFNVFSIKSPHVFGEDFVGIFYVYYLCFMYDPFKRIIENTSITS